MCIVSRDVRPKDELLRFVLAPDGAVTPDLKQNLPGRGVWTNPDRTAVSEAVKKGLFARGFKQQVPKNADLPDLVARLMKKQALNLLSLCNRAGLITTGFEKVASALGGKKPVRLLLHANDASEDGVRKLCSPKAGLETVSMFSRDEMSLALGQANVVHAAVRKGDLADHLVRAAKRFENYNGLSDGQMGEQAAQ
ncbi:MAG: RNA-binding protein [Hyphomicrobiales bacterium]|nr:RNA-binding protein [Hyphomicrobiales bacterium]